MRKVFVSYCHVKPDEDLAAELVQFLETNGIGAFIDTKIKVGQEWTEQIDRHLRAARYFVVLLSSESIRSDMVRREIAVAHGLRKANQLSILPVRVGLDAELPYDVGAYLHGLQYAVWRTGQTFGSICQSILERIENPSALGMEEADPPPELSDANLPQLAMELHGAPLPAADPRLETGAVQLDSPFYVRRVADTDVSRLVCQSGVTVLVKGPRQVGKTSLLARAQALAKSRGHRTVYLDFQLIDEAHFQSLRSVLLYFGQRLARDLRTSIKPADVWDDLLGGPESLTTFFERAVLEESPIDVTLSLDEVDRIFEYDFRNAFFAMIRAWHNRRASNPAWTAVNLLIGHSTEPALFIDNINQSPFNVGEVIRLGDFTSDEVERLNGLYGSPLRTRSEIEELMGLVGGHPFLARQCLYWLRRTRGTIGDLKRVAANDDGPLGDHLRRYLWMLRDKNGIRDALSEVLHDSRCKDEVSFQRLCAAGLVKGESRGSASLRCKLYERYFSKHL
jgi:hypothetical protein